MTRLIILSAGFILTSLFVMCKEKDHVAQKRIAVAAAPGDVSVNENEPARLAYFAGTAKGYVRQKGLCERYCFFSDMHLGSGKKRFFIYDLSADTIISSGMVAHGSGSETGTAQIKFSNEPGSNATSQGRYKTGEEYNGKFGLAFKLHGLDVTNSNAYKRAVVLHAHPLIPDNETYPKPICLSWGCPTVSPDYLQQLKKYINESEKPVLLWVLE